MPHSSKTVALIANGAVYNYPAIYPLIRTCTEVYAVDGGLFHCQNMGIEPQLILGDFDSVNPELLNAYGEIPKKAFPVDKDQTDLELAVSYALEKGFERISLFAALGKRIDHSLNNLYLLGRHPKELIAVTEDEILFAIEGKKTLAIEKGQTLSLLPLFGDVTVSTKGLKWELNNHKLNYRFLSQSNVVLSSSVEIDVKNGIVLCSLL